MPPKNAPSVISLSSTVNTKGLVPTDDLPGIELLNELLPNAFAQSSSTSLLDQTAKGRPACDQTGGCR
jgi:hypothetical protein